MHTIPNDTSLNAQEILFNGYRAMSVQKKLRCVSELTKAVQEMALARIKKQYGDMPEREQKLRLASLWLDRDTMVKVFGWDPEKQGY
jgi:hypothetical protein